MTDLPNAKNTNVKKSQNLTRDNKGRFVSGNTNDNAKTNTVFPTDDNTQNDFSTMPQPPQDQKPVSAGFNKETLPNVEEIYLEEAEKTKELKEQLQELEKTTEVREIKGEVELPEIVKEHGLEPAGESVPVSTTTNIVLPLDDTKVYKIVKKIKNFHQDIKSSITWLALWCYRQLAMFHIKLKEVNGKVIREEEK